MSLRSMGSRPSVALLAPVLPFSIDRLDFTFVGSWRSARGSKSFGVLTATLFLGIVAILILTTVLLSGLSLFPVSIVLLGFRTISCEVSFLSTVKASRIVSL